MFDTEYRNALRYAGTPTWFDFYNLRVTLPEQRRFFYIMPLFISGPDSDPSARGMWLYDGGNGGPDGLDRCAHRRVPEGQWSASAERCLVTWQGQEFSATRVRAEGPSTRWDITLRPFLGDVHSHETNKRRFDLVERMLMRRAPFAHRVPRMKAWADGWVEQNGRRWEVDRGVVYQAKNHGPSFPDRWTWIHANAFEQNPELAFEAALMPSAGGDMAMVRVATPQGVRTLMSWTGAQVSVSLRDGEYRVKASDDTTRLSARASHGPSVQFRFPDPRGGGFDVDECLTGALELELDGQRLSTKVAALGWASRVPEAPSSES